MATKQNPIRPHRTPVTQMVQDVHLVWLDENIDEKNDDFRISIAKLEQAADTVNTFTDVDTCINFIDSINKGKAIMIISGALGQTTISLVHDKLQVNTIYIFCVNKAQHEKWAQKWNKIAGVFTDITPICEAIKQAALDCHQSSISIGFIQKTDGLSNQNLKTLDQSFMYTQILREILLTIEFEQTHIDAFLQYARQKLARNTEELKYVDKLAKEYRSHQPIWWYTYQSFLYYIVDRALSEMEVNLIVKIGFFIRDLHNHIFKLHAEQFGGQNHSNTFIVYHGEGLSQVDFRHLKSTQGGLLSFNNFLSTTENRDVSLDVARRIISTSDLVGVLFVMKIDPSIQATPFAKVENVGYDESKGQQILFSMHSVFRIGQVKHLDGNNRLQQVELTLTSDNDPQLHALTKRMQEETHDTTGWHRLSKSLIKLGQYNKAEELCNILLKQTNDERDKSILFHQLGRIKDDQEKYTQAVEFYEKSIKIQEKILSPTDPDLKSSYNNIGLVYDNMSEYSKALSYYEKALEIQEKTLPTNYPDLATSYNNIAWIYRNMNKYSEALSYFERALDIWERSLPSDHPHVQSVKKNIEILKNKL